MPRPDRSNALDHIVVIMFENRSFDNLLGRLYEPGEVPFFDGVTGRELSNPVPEWAQDAGTSPGQLPYGIAADMNTGREEVRQQHNAPRAPLNTTLRGGIDVWLGQLQKRLGNLIAAPP